MAVITEIEIDTATLQRDIDNLRQYLDSMKRKGDAMMNGINNLSSMWEGLAKDEFTRQFQEDYRVLTEMEKVIEELIEKLESAKEKYNSCENSVGAIINSIRV